MKLFVQIFVSFLSLVSYAQTPNYQAETIELFKEKLQQYFDKHRDTADDQMMVKRPNSSYNMPTGNLRSFMIDEELDLAYEFATQQIYDKNSTLTYLIEKEKIYDTEADAYYDFRIK